MPASLPDMTAASGHLIVFCQHQTERQCCELPQPVGAEVGSLGKVGSQSGPVGARWQAADAHAALVACRRARRWRRSWLWSLLLLDRGYLALHLCYARLQLLLPAGRLRRLAGIKLRWLQECPRSKAPA